MKFEFRLQKMLHFTEMREAVKKSEIARLQSDLVTLSERKKKLTEDARDLLDKQYQNFDNGLQSLHYSTQKVLLNFKEATRLDGMIQNTKERLEFRVQELQMLMQKRKGLEKLREKKMAEFKLVKNRKEQHDLDDLFTLSKGRQS